MTYRYYRDLFRGRTMPFAFVDLERFDQNVTGLLERAGSAALCAASKSLRCVTLLRRVFQASPRFHSILAYSAREAVYLADNGFDNIRVAYPVWREAEPSRICDALKAGKTITLMVDCPQHIEHLERLGAAAGVVIPLCIDLDMSLRYPGLHFGVRRSNVATPDQALVLWRHIEPCKHLRLDGVMGYEAQVAGIPDRPPGNRLRNGLVRLLKRRSVAEAARRRASVVKALEEAGCRLRFVNGGGTGSVETTCEDDAVTEVTVGSGFYSPALFDHYDRFRHQPAAVYAIEIVRRPAEHIYTCHGGGYVASGAAGPDKLPQPYLPEGARLLPHEGAGEVQTPVVYDGDEALAIGDPIFMRHAKAGELCERFNTLLLVSKGQVVDEVPTYRGEGQCFL